MIYKLDNGKNIKIDDKTIQNLMSILDLTKEDAIQTYLEDEGYLDNEEQNILDEKAKEVLISRDTGKKAPKKSRKKPEIKISDEKKALFDNILTNLTHCEGIEQENIKIAIQNKKIEVKFNDKSFSIDIIQHRNPKN